MNTYAQAPTISKVAAPKFDVENEKALIKQYQSTNDMALKNSILKKMSKIHRGTIIYAMQSATGYALSAEAKNVIIKSDEISAKYLKIVEETIA